MKVARTVLRGGTSSNVSPVLDRWIFLLKMELLFIIKQPDFLGAVHLINLTNRG
jgi:hypothetical protein